jgi:predicted Zn-dependent protease with MMP-like domain
VVILIAAEPDGDDPHLLGLYEGYALTERGSNYGFVLPDRITIYRRPTLRMCDSEAEVVDEVRITVVHEIAHHFGIDDKRLHDLGWG